jgi:hypothetical protein
MKYKVVLATSYSTGNQGAAGATFFRLQDAVDACTAWNELGGNYSAYLWDGTQWRSYT